MLAFQLAARLARETPPQWPTGFHFCLKTFGLNVSIAVRDLAIFESGHVQHAVAIKGMVFVFGFKQWIFGIAQVNAVNVPGYFTLQHLQVSGIDFFPQRCPRTLEVRVIVRDNIAWIGVYNFFFHSTRLQV